MEGGRWGRRIGDVLNGGDVLRRKLNVAAFGGAEVEAFATIDEGVVVAADIESVAESDALG